MKSVLTLWADLEAARDDSSMNLELIHESVWNPRTQLVILYSVAACELTEHLASGGFLICVAVLSKQIGEDC